MPQLSGRGLGHTGGTLDKLESIPGWRAALSNQEMLDQLESVGAVICAAGDELAPADKKLYALRDVTGTVEAIPLIASSIMSKKIAEGTGSLVLDVKVGTGAFMKTPSRPASWPRRWSRWAPTPAYTRSRCSPRCRPRSGGPPATGSRSRSRSRCWPAAGPTDVVELTLALAREMLAGAGRDDVDPCGDLEGLVRQVRRELEAADRGDVHRLHPDGPPDAGTALIEDAVVADLPLLADRLVGLVGEVLRPDDQLLRASSCAGRW